MKEKKKTLPEKCACGREGCTVWQKPPSSLGPIVIDDKYYRGICGIGVLYRRSDALKFYARRKNWKDKSAIKDQGALARKALQKAGYT